MKIDNSVKTVGGLPSGETRARPAKEKAPSPQGGDAQVELSSLSSSLQQAEAALANVPVVDSQRVAEIKQAISEGRFKVDAEKVADGLIQNVRELLDSQPRGA